MRWTVVVLLAAALGGCVSAFPEAATRTVNRAISAAELRRDPMAYRDQRVIVGGEILATRPRPGETELEILAKPLRSDDSPDRDDRTEGRVLVKTPEFLDPAVYAEGRRVTVLGVVAGQEERTIGELPYRYPVITAERIRLWPREYAIPLQSPRAYAWDHFYWPYWGYYPYPYPYRYRLAPPPYWWW
ncbi:MAG TPA: Slp family lipoprotein [Methylomirabilota bacterium]|nr:Slp family lipoprotein [Methylomirabilota bacterium]